jgi:hypothetical protein
LNPRADVGAGDVEAPGTGELAVPGTGEPAVPGAGDGEGDGPADPAAEAAGDGATGDEIDGAAEPAVPAEGTVQAPNDAPRTGGGVAQSADPAAAAPLDAVGPIVVTGDAPAVDASGGAAPPGRGSATIAMSATAAIARAPTPNASARRGSPGVIARA